MRHGWSASCCICSKSINCTFKSCETSITISKSSLRPTWCEQEKKPISPAFFTALVLSIKRCLKPRFAPTACSLFLAKDGGSMMTILKLFLYFCSFKKVKTSFTCKDSQVSSLRSTLALVCAMADSETSTKTHSLAPARSA